MGYTKSPQAVIWLIHKIWLEIADYADLCNYITFVTCCHNCMKLCLQQTPGPLPSLLPSAGTGLLIIKPAPLSASSSCKVWLSGKCLRESFFFLFNHWAERQKIQKSMRKWLILVTKQAVGGCLYYKHTYHADVISDPSGGIPVN